jgi:hypothetical protein
MEMHWPNSLNKNLHEPADKFVGLVLIFSVTQLKNTSWQSCADFGHTENHTKPTSLSA